ncbi:MAG: metalloregulator ArsR/SmtB family transcription factor [Gammaproteobacteria bacterium]|nr:metalloregulator ArsR/SmtB family transcription factor [Gammaproteobacteria bacterium]MDH5729643.1 metalloregulator ArsR/SmtB family transcription factor [Gammaproteobacteria bacterium]
MSTFKKQLFIQFALIGKALSSANRLEMLEYLSQRACSVEDLAHKCGLSVANTSHHLQQLKNLGLILSEKQGLYVIYSLADDDVIRLLADIRLVAERHLGQVNDLIDQYLTTKDNLEAIPPDELLQRVKQGLVTVLDVRPSDEFEAGHLLNAINIPLSQLKNKLNSLPPNKEVIAYCRGPHCLLAFDAVALLRQHNFKASRLDGGFPEWKCKGLPVEK